MSNDKSILWRLAEQGQAAPRVNLKGTERNVSAEERYEVLGEIARGGVGVVQKGRDNDLGRDVALKVLLDEHVQTPELVQRFVEEAQIGGQLQHPGIVPVYELGLRADQRPFFAMKLVKGETLAARLAKGTERRRALLAVFRDVCRTMAYAHARGVIHRDLKPSNVMIGNFGEVQVVDWGFAKVLRRGGVADEQLAKKAQRDITMISTHRAADSVAGSVMGTPAYMPPEQAMGRVEDLDEKSDLFALGAILCEILTGAPPYASRSGYDRMHAAAQALLEPALKRLDVCGADDRLVSLCKRCLEPLPKDRPTGADELADEIAAFLTSAEGRAHRASLRALKAEGRAVEQRRARRFMTLVGTSVVGALLIATAAFFVVDASRTRRIKERQAAIETALQDAARLRAAKDWPAAQVAAQRAIDLGHDGALANEIRAEAARAKEAATRRDQEETLLAGLDQARGMGADHFKPSDIEAAYAAAVKTVWPSGEVDTERLKASEHAPAFAAAFDAWANARASAGRKDTDQMDAWARAIDPANNRLRDAIDATDADALEAMIAKVDLRTLPPAMIAHVSMTLRGKYRFRAIVALLQRAQRLHPGDFWIHQQLAWAAHEIRDHEMAVRHGLAALAIRPESVEARHWTGIFLQAKGDLEGAYELWRGALERRPDWVHGWSHIVFALVRLGRKEEAHAFLKESLLRNPQSAVAYVEMGRFQREHLGQVDDARASFARAYELDPKELSAATTYAMMLVQLGRPDEAIALLGETVKAHPKKAWIVTNLGDAYYQRATRTRPANRADLKEAIACFRKALTLNRNLVHARVSLANALSHRRDKVPEAVEHLRKAVARKPWSGYAQRNLGMQLINMRKYDEAAVHLTKATKLTPNDGRAWHWLARALVNSKGEDATAARLLKAAEADPKQSYVIGNQLADILGRHEEAVVLFELARKNQPKNALLLYALGTSLNGLGRFAEALPHFDASLALMPEYPQGWCNRGWCLRGLGRWSEAVDAFRKGHALGSKQPGWRFPSAQWLADTERLVKLEPKLNELLAGKDVAATPLERVRLARMCAAKKRYTLSIAAYKRAFKENPSLARDPYGQHGRAIRMAILAGAPHRAQAIAWFRAWLERLRSELPRNPARVRRQIYWWKRSPWFSSTRKNDAHADWKRFWADAEALQAQAK